MAALGDFATCTLVIRVTKSEETFLRLKDKINSYCFSYVNAIINIITGLLLVSVSWCIKHVLMYSSSNQGV